MFRRIFKYTSAKNILILNVKSNSNVTNLKFSTLKSKTYTTTSLLEINFIQRRFCSSDTPRNAVHKVFFVNAESPPENDPSTLKSDTIEYIPPPPLPPDVPVTEESLTSLNSLGEATFESLGLGGWTPIGLFQNAIEYLHVSVDLPWWGAIAAITFVIRTCLFPLVILAQRNAAKMSNCMPAIQRLQTKITDARNCGDNLEVARLSYELQNYMKKSGINPLRSMLVPLAQAPIFISMFIGLRRCANLPVESMKDGGMMWFTDLTIADPFYALPLITSLTMLATIEVGSEGQSISNQTSKVAKYALRGIPLIIFPFSLHFPSAILCYWVSTNFCSLLQVGFLRIPKVRSYFNIDQLRKHNKDDLPKDKKGFMEGIKESWSNMKVTSEIDERHRIDEVRFKKAGTGPLMKTYKHNPLKKNVIDVRAKPKDQ